MKNKVILFLVFGVLLAGLAWMMVQGRTRPGRDVLVICGGTMRPPMEAVIQRYGLESKDRILATYGDSGEIMAQLQNTGKGDVFVVHDPFMDWARQRGLAAEGAGVGYLDNVIVVPKGNPLGIRDVSDLARNGLRLGVGDRRYSTSGVMVGQMLDAREDGAAIASNIVTEARSHGQRCTDVELGALDAAIVWSAAARTHAGKLEAIPIPAEAVDAVTSATYGRSDLRNVQVAIGLATPGRANPAARRFYEFATTRCSDIFESAGFRLTPNKVQ
jgi:molybdate transport system substrate-binding protein